MLHQRAKAVCIKAGLEAGPEGKKMGLATLQQKLLIQRVALPCLDLPTYPVYRQTDTVCPVRIEVFCRYRGLQCSAHVVVRNIHEYLPSSTGTSRS